MSDTSLPLKDWGARLCEILKLDKSKTQGLTIRVTPYELVTVLVERTIDTEEAKKIEEVLEACQPLILEKEVPN